MTRDEMTTELCARVCRVIFTKVNGEQRDMLCTTNQEFIPEDKRPKTGKEHADTVIRAFDINKQEFRSFRVENVVSFS
jgi:hypothetical protein